MSALLTPQAFATAGDACGHWTTTEKVLEAFLRYHATEGREALVKRVREAISASYGCAIPRDVAEAVVTALVGERDV